MIPLPKPPKVIQKKGNTALFEIEALYPGYGITVGNSLRRILLSSLEGAAITQVKIKGVGHEFSTIPGVFEDIIIILLNLKKLSFKVFTTEPQTIILKEKGQKEVKAKNFKLSPQVELTTPGAHIATLTSKKAELNLEAQIEQGVGYSPVEEREQKKAEVGVIPIDAIFTPVKKVSFHVENMRVGKRTDFDRLKLEIETDGTISPEEALKQASEILLSHFSLFSEEIGKEMAKKQKKKKPVAPVSAKAKAGKKTKAVKKEKKKKQAGKKKTSKKAAKSYEKKKTRKKVS